MTVRECREQDAREQLRHNRYKRRMERKAVKAQKKQLTSWILEFSKKVVVMCVLLHLATFIYAAVVMWRCYDTTALPTIISESSEVLRTCVFGYMVKAGIENWQKIKKTETTTQKNEEEGVG